MAGALESLAAAAKLAAAVAARRDAFSRDRGSVAADLRTIRFADDGILMLINDLVDGRKPNAEFAREHLTEFNDGEWATRAAIGRLAGDAGPIEGVSRRMGEQLAALGNGKSNLRHEVQKEINSYLQPRAQIDVERLKHLRDEIENLNEAIDAAEDAVIHGR